MLRGRSRWAGRLPISHHVSTDAQTQTIPRVPAAVVAGAHADVATARRVEVTREESVQDIYEAGLAKLDALHDRWVAGIAQLHEAQAMNVPGEAAA